MKEVGKYNLFKGISTLLGVGTPIITFACCGDFFVHRTDTAMSAGAIFAILISMLFFKDKILETFKAPSELVVVTIVFVAILVVESVLVPVKNVCLATMVACGVDELSFKKLYKNAEKLIPEVADNYKHFGFIFAKTSTVNDKQLLLNQSNGG